MTATVQLCWIQRAANQRCLGQRYNVIVEADQATANYWMRAIPQSACSSNSNSDDIKGIVRYDASSTSDPTSTGYDSNGECVDEDSSDLVPYVSQTVGDVTDSDTGDGLNVALGTSGNLFKWRIGSTSMVVEWADPTLMQMYNNETSWNASEAVIELDTADEWVYFIIESTLAVPHPIHLHGKINIPFTSTPRKHAGTRLSTTST